MNDYYNEPKHLNIKKILIVALILIILLILLVVFIFKKFSTPPETIESNAPTSTTYFSNDNSVSVELSNKYALNQNTESDYLLDLCSENNLNIYISKEENSKNKQLSEIVNIDKNIFLNNFSSNSNISDVKELSVNGNQAYTYSFHYLDKNLNQAFYLQVTWLEIENNIYIFDIEFPLDDLSFNTNISSDVLSSFKEQ